MHRLRQILDIGEEFINHISDIISLISAKTEQGIDIYVTIDYSVLHKYLFPTIHNFVSPNDLERSRAILQYVSRRFFFEIVPEIGNYIEWAQSKQIVFLPPYVEEMREVMKARHRQAKYPKLDATEQVDITSKIKKLLDDQNFMRILSQGALEWEDYERISEITKRLDHVFLHFLGTQMGMSATHEATRVLGWDEDVPFLHPSELEQSKVADIFQRLTAFRPNPYARIRNYTDALALYYVININQKMSNKNKRLVLVTDTQAVLRVASELNAKLPTANGSGRIPLACHQDAAIPFLLDLDKDCRRILSNLEGRKRKLSDLIGTYKGIIEKIELDDFEKRQEYLARYIENATESVCEDLLSYRKWGLYNKISGAFVGEDRGNHISDIIFNKILINKKAIPKIVVSSLQKLFSELQEGGIERILEFYLQSAKDGIEASLFLGLIDNPLNSTIDNYFFDKRCYRSATVRELISDIRSGKIRKQVEATKRFERLKKEKNYEAILLAAYLLSKVQYYDLKAIDDAITDLEKRRDDGTRNLLFQFYFLRNLLLSRKGGESFDRAVRESETLAQKLGEYAPRLWVHAGYLRYRKWQAKRNESDLSKAIKCEKMACKYSRNEPNSVKCFAIACANLALFYADKAFSVSKHKRDFQISDKYFSRLDMFRKEELLDNVPLFSYVEGQSLAYKIMSISDSPTDEDRERFKRFSEIVEELQHYLPHVSEFTRKKYRELTKKRDDLAKRF